MKKTVTVDLDPEVLARLETVAQQTGWTKQQIMNMALRQLLRNSNAVSAEELNRVEEFLKSLPEAK